MTSVSQDTKFAEQPALRARPPKVRLSLLRNISASNYMIEAIAGVALE